MDNQEKTKFCKFCGAKIHEEAVVCTACGRQVENIEKNVPQQSPQIVINNSNTNTNANANFNGFAGYGMKCCNKWVALCLCIFLGYFGAHKFYESKTVMGIVYIFTFGLFGIGWLVDIIAILCKPNPYFVRY